MSGPFAHVFDATLVWLDDSPPATSATWLVGFGDRVVRGHFVGIERRAASAWSARGTLRARLRLHEPLAPESRDFVVLDATTRREVGAGTIDA